MTFEDDRFFFLEIRLFKDFFLPFKAAAIAASLIMLHAPFQREVIGMDIVCFMLFFLWLLETLHIFVH